MVMSPRNCGRVLPIDNRFKDHVWQVSTLEPIDVFDKFFQLGCFDNSLLHHLCLLLLRQLRAALLEAVHVDAAVEKLQDWTLLTARLSKIWKGTRSLQFLANFFCQRLRLQEIFLPDAAEIADVAH